MDRPIPSFYCCYLLRSKACPKSVYVGSTTNPVRRQNQHNGLRKGGAARTSRGHLRPWEMVSVVSGFASHISALQFELFLPVFTVANSFRWAWQNPHITTHIPPESRIQSTGTRKQSGLTKRPRHSVHSLLSNLHLLLRMPYFSRWPLKLHFSSEKVYEDWAKLCKNNFDQIPRHIKTLKDFQLYSLSSCEIAPKRTGHDLPLGFRMLKIDYSNLKLHVEKAKEIIDFEQEGNCAICQEELEHDKGIYTVCPSPTCEAVTHMTCLSKQFLGSCKDQLLPIKGRCTVCKTEILWIDIVKELSLRLRGFKEVQNLLKVKKTRKSNTTQTLSKDMIESDDGEESDGFYDIGENEDKASSELDMTSTSSNTS